MGMGGGRGMGGPSQGRGRGGGAPMKCVCPQCGHESTKERGTPCRSMKCPKCGVQLVGA